MRKNSDLVCWARAWKWPQLVIDQANRLVVRAGEESWRAFAARPNRKAKLLAWQRIHQWNDLAADAEEDEQLVEQGIA